MMMFFAKIVNGFYPLTIFAKELDWQGPKYPLASLVLCYAMADFLLAY